MDNNNKVEFATLMTSTGEMYNKKISTDLMKLYFNILSKYSIDEVKHGFSNHMLDSKHGTFFPKPADIARHIDSGQPSVENMAELAWGVVIGEISRVGSYGNLEMEDKQALAAVRALGGWKNLCSKTNEQLIWMKKEFTSVYSTYENTPLDMLPSNLPGRIELENHKTKDSKLLAQFHEKKKMFEATGQPPQHKENKE